MNLIDKKEFNRRMIKKKTSFNTIGIFALFVLLLFITPISTSANQDSNFPYKVTPVFNENQNPDVSNYFDLIVKPNTKEKLKVKIRNITDRQITIKVEPANALTSINGGIFYTTKSSAENSYLTDSFFALKPNIKVEKNIITLKPKEEIQFPVVIDIPDFDKGSLLGALKFSYKDNDSETKYENKEKTATFSLKSKYDYAMAIKVNYKDEDKTKFEFGGVYSAFYPSGFRMMIQMENHSAKIINAQKILYTVLNKNEEVIFDGELSSIKMAPKTKIKFPVKWESSSIDQKEYKVILQSVIDGKEQQEEANLNIEKNSEKTKPEKEDKFYAHPDVKIDIDGETKSSTIILWIGFFLLSFLILFFLFLWRKRRKKEEEEDNTKEKFYNE